MVLSSEVGCLTSGSPFRDVRLLKGFAAHETFAIRLAMPDGGGSCVQVADLCECST
jgi:hypothetical protein